MRIGYGRQNTVFLVAVAAFLALAAVSAAQTAPALVGDEGFRVIKAAYDYDADIPLEARVVDLKEYDTSVRRKIVFRSARGFLVPGYLEIPKQAVAPSPCVLLIHGWSGAKENWWEDGNFISGSAAREAILA